MKTTTFCSTTYRHKVKPDKAGKRKRDSVDSATGSQAKKIRGQISRSNEDEEREEGQGESHDEQPKIFEEFDKGLTHFNVEDFLSNLEKILASMKEAFGQEDIAKYSAHLEAMRIKSLRVAKVEKKCRKEEAQTKLVHETGSSATPMATREPLPSPTVLLPQDEDTHMDTSSLEHEEEQGQGGEQVPQ